MFDGDLKFQHQAQEGYCSAQVELYREDATGFELERVGTVVVQQGEIQLVSESLFSVAQFQHILHEAASFFRKHYPGSLPANPILSLSHGVGGHRVQLSAA